MKTSREGATMLRRHAALVALLAAVLAAGADPPLVHAGEYAVYACEPAYGDVNHSWFATVNNPRMTAYTNCPVPWNELRTWNQGLVTRESVTAPGTTSTVSGFSAASLRLRAPPGAVLSRITYEHTFCGMQGFVAGLFVGSLSLHVSGPGSCGTFVPSPWTLSLNGATWVSLMTMCAQPTCQLTTKLQAWASLRRATVWVRDATRPSVAITGGSIIGPGWHRGTQSVVIRASDNVGLRQADLYLDSKASVRQTGRCDWTFVVPCSLSLSGLGVDSNIVPDGAHALVARVEDSAGNSASVSRRVLIDNTAPVGPLDLRSGSGDAWRATNAFDVTWTNPPQPGTAPITGVAWTICPSVALRTTAECVRGRRSGTNIQRLARMTVPAPGDWTGRFWLIDAAGNAEPASARPVRMRFDDAAPMISLLDADSEDPQRLSVAASDVLSGLSRVEMEVRRSGDSAWISLPVTQAGNVFNAWVDDSVLPAGRYLVRARAIDHAGNERSTEQRRTGEPALLDLPVRVRTTLDAGTTRLRRGPHGRVRSVVRRAATTGFGGSTLIHGRLVLPGGNPVARTDVEVFQRLALPDAVWRRVGVVQTDDHGRFAFRARRGPSRTLGFLYRGTPLIQPRRAFFRLRVRASSSLAVSRRRVVNGEDVVFRGRVRGRVPSSGKLIQLQAYSRDGWRTFATPRARPRNHRWRYRYRFTATRGLVRYRFRAHLPPESGFPYVNGSSRQVRVTVRGL